MSLTHPLPQWPALHTLWLVGCDIVGSARVLQSVAALVTLTDLDLCTAGSVDVQLLAPCVSLTKLNLRGTPIMLVGLQTLAELTNLRSLILDKDASPDVADIVLARVATLPCLTDLDISHRSYATDTTLQELGRCGTLIKLNLWGRRLCAHHSRVTVTDKGVVALETKLPELDVFSPLCGPCYIR